MILLRILIQSLANFLAKVGKLEEAEQLYREDVASQAAGKWDFDFTPSPAAAVTNLAEFYIHCGRSDDAIFFLNSARQKLTNFAANRLPRLTEKRRKKFSGRQISSGTR